MTKNNRPGMCFTNPLSKEAKKVIKNLERDHKYFDREDITVKTINHGKLTLTLTWFHTPKDENILFD